MIVTHIDNKGYLRIAPIGGVNFASIAYSNVLFENGVIGVLLPEAKVDANDWKHDKMYIDIGATDKKDAEKKRAGLEEEYNKEVNKVIAFLKGETQEIESAATSTLMPLSLRAKGILMF